MSRYICASVLVSDISKPLRKVFNRVVFRVKKTIEAIAINDNIVEVLLGTYFFENIMMAKGVKKMRIRVILEMFVGKKKFRYAKEGNRTKEIVNIFSMLYFFISSYLGCA